MRVQKVEYQKVLEQELANIKRELESKFSEFGSRLERYYKRQCLHVHQHRQVIEWYHTQIQLQGLNQTRSNLMNDKEEADTDIDADAGEINNAAQSNNIRLSYPIATEWNMEDEDTDENQFTSNYPRSRDRGKTEALHKNKKQNLEVKNQNETQQVILGKIKTEIDIIQNLSLEKDFQSLLERIHQIKQSVIEL
ncbi:hypothetical protein RFI_02415 [Reticulomyxa filosa]|uniref:Uncharacterized protein n=1 Tax=Reticulomyxa filosa TaxID=46433 RepID=X6PAK5_RETFI|nr:hypothetical protein RFI_02415 [Reticulomyxa filosa]|eukprot:ETO34677.1 hypothetical protein RFI_02415 [Reticulomyxa filosa]